MPQGAELTARMEVVSPGRLAVVVNDSGGVYPLRIDPNFSDANWASLGGILGTANGNLFDRGGCRTALFMWEDFPRSAPLCRQHRRVVGTVWCSTRVRGELHCQCLGL